MVNRTRFHGRSGKLLQNAALGAALLLSLGSNNGFAGERREVQSDKKAEAERAQERKDAIRELKRMDTVSLEEVRESCADGSANKIRERQLARDNGFPEVSAWCMAAIDAAAPRNLSQHLYMALALQDMGKGYGADSAEAFDRLKDGQDGVLAAAITNAAAKGETSYESPLTGKVYPLRTELAYDAGHWAGQINPDAVPNFPAAELERGAQACYAFTNVATITLNGKDFPATQACVLIGANFGKHITAKNPNNKEGAIAAPG